MPTNKNELLDAALAGVRGVMLTNPAVADKTEDVLAVMRGDKIATLPTQQAEIEKPYTRKELAKLFGVTPYTIDYHYRHGRLTPVRFPGSTRAVGFTRESVRRCFGVAGA